MSVMAARRAAVAIARRCCELLIWTWLKMGRIDQGQYAFLDRKLLVNIEHIEKLMKAN
jgi:hypothetical protein